MRIVLNTTPLLGPLTGIGQYVHHLAMELAKLREHEVHYYTGRTWSRLPPSPSMPNMNSLICKIRRAMPFGYDLSRLIQIQGFGGRSADFDLYHEPNYLALPFDGATVVTVHDFSWLHYPQYHPKIRIKAMERYFDRAVRQACHLLTDSEYVRQEVIKYLSFPADKVTAVPLGLEHDCRPRNAAECQGSLLRQALTFKQYFLVVGTLEPRKNLGTILQAYRNLAPSIRRRYPLVIAGMAGWGDNPFSRRFADLLAAGQVRYLGYLPRRELLEIMAAARALLYPSIYEGFGLPPLEAMGCGVIPVVSAASSLPEVVGDIGIQLMAEDTEAWTQAMEGLTADTESPGPEYANRLLERAGRFSWQKCAAETVAVYQKVLKTA
ncbi:glycosyltransferase family 4 protein [Methylomonas sp. SURF-2]|uniref:Glycosyltransferase family 4 protein n=1 Tax=Methylomonas subterranea TaxID=2952225 RepID=A0ABT1TIE4_9GAMM|nr:glycosyltransferase family 1 protein [Methylomonas sp. SURF-2]MCQ8104539.1 glycosyltransferase family 4 protein [Methylomonas sp. SURF-2]